MLIDSHCHLDLIDYDKAGLSMDDVVKQAGERGVDYLLSISVRLEDFSKLCGIADKYSNVFISMGIHPNETDCIDPDTDGLTELANSHKKVIAIGETGLDYFRSEGDLAWQRDRFIRHIEAANRVNKPLIVHTREAASDTMQMLKEHNAAAGVIHCFTETKEVAKQALDLGFYIAFSGIVTFKNAKQIQEAAKYVPLDRILVETDSPYLAPMPHRGKDNFPKYVLHVAEFLAQLRDESLDKIKEATSNNFQELFKVNL